MDIQLGVNIDHIATLRNARGEGFPSVIQAANTALDAGAHSIVCHLREDRRHIKDEDVFMLRKGIIANLNLEMALRDDVIKLSFDIKPEKVTLVPENREELTTEGGLNVSSAYPMLRTLIPEYGKNSIETFLFIEPELKTIEQCRELGCTGIELHTGKYANAKGEDLNRELEKIRKASEFADKLGLKVAAGHGLNYWNTIDIVSIPEIFELNIGFSIISNAVFNGLGSAVQKCFP